MTFVKRSLSVAILVSFGSFAACGTSTDDENSPGARPSGAHRGQSSVTPPSLRAPTSSGLSRNLATGSNVAMPMPLLPVENEVVVQLRPRAQGRSASGNQLLSTNLGRVARNVRTAGQLAAVATVGSAEIFTVEVDPAGGRTVDDVIRDLKQLPDVEFAEPNYRYQATATPNDPEFSTQFHLTQIRAPQAWDVTTGSSSTVVGILDTGIELTHPDLAANIWRNPGETAGDNIDNDSNGFVDDVTGYDFVSVSAASVAPGEDPAPPDNNPTDVAGHGTHVAGIVGAVGNNATNVTGVAWNVKLMPLRAGYKASGGSFFLLSDAAAAIRYAADKGAHVLNMSFGGGHSQILADALRYAADRNVVLVASAGNAGITISQHPASADRVLSVTAWDSGRMANFSSYGAWVDVTAPGASVLSTMIGGTTGYMGGTSMASPVVAGVAALVRASHPTWTAQQIAEKITSTTAESGSTPLKYFAGLVDAAAAVTAPTALATFELVNAQIEELTGDGDGNVEPGESGRIHAAIKNLGPAAGATVSLATSQSGVTISGSPVTLSSFGHTRIRTAVFGFTLPSSLPVTAPVTFNVTTTSGSRTFVDPVLLEQPRWAPPRVLADAPSTFGTITGLPNGSIAVVAELEGSFVTQTANSIVGIVKSPSGSWSAPVTLNNPAGDALDANARVAPDGSLDVVFRRNVGNFNYEFFYRRYTPSTSSWSAAEEQVTTNAVLESPNFDHVTSNAAVARDTTGRLHVAWVDSAGLPRTIRYTTRTASSGWSAPVTIGTFSETDLLGANLQMLVLPDNSRRLVVQRYSASIGLSSYREVVLSGTGTTWQAPVNAPVFYDGRYAPFLQGSNLYRIIKRTAPSDPIELVRWSGSAWVADRVITTNLTGDVAFMDQVAGAAMNANNQFGFLVAGGPSQELLPLDYFSGLAGALTSVRATARTPLTMRAPRLWLASNNVAHAVVGQPGFASGQATTYLSSTVDAGVVIAAKPTVTATFSATTFNMNWTHANPAQVSRYLMAAGTSPGGDDLMNWQPLQGATSFALPITEIQPLPGEIYYASVRAVSTSGHLGPIGFSAAVPFNSCTPETNAQFCTRLGKNCGSVTGADNCGVSRTVSSCGTCTSPQTCGGGGTTNVCGGGGTSTPCTNLCTSPTVFTGPSFQSNNLGTAATCHQTLANLNGLACGNFATGRTFRINGTVINCNSATLPPKVNGGYCFQSTAGDFAWAYFSTW